VVNKFPHEQIVCDPSLIHGKNNYWYDFTYLLIKLQITKISLMETSGLTYNQNKLVDDKKKGLNALLVP